MDWDDLRVFLAAARAGSLSLAARRLGLDAATVGRKITRLETALKSTLLTRAREGLQLTGAGALIMEAAEAAESAVERAARVAESDIVGGTVRLSAAEGFGVAILAEALPQFALERPNLRIELAATAGFLSATRREVDMAITLRAPRAQRLIVEPLTEYQLALYASSAYLAREGAPTSVSALREHRVVGYIEDLIYADELRYLDEICPSLRPHLSSSSIQAQTRIIQAGGGIGVLPCFLSSQLTRVLPEIVIERRFWLSTHADVHDTARFKAVRGWLRDLVEKRRSALCPH